jgi:hypothetical protein
LQIGAAEVVLAAAPNLTSRARLILAAAPSSGAFLQVVPMSSVGSRLDDTTMRIAVALLFDALIVYVPHRCLCGATVGSTGVRGLSSAIACLPVVLHAIQLSMKS